MYKIQTIFENEKVWTTLLFNKFKITEHSESLDIKIFENLCEECIKNNIKVILLNYCVEEKYYDFIGLCSEIAKKYNLLFVLVGINSTVDKLKFLNTGLFDFVTREDEIKLMIARLKNIIQLLNNINDCKTTNNSLKNIKFTSGEIELFNLLINKENEIVTYMEIKHIYFRKTHEDCVFGYEMDAIKSMVSKIRRKLKDTNYKVINVKRRGYKLIIE